MNNLLIDIGNSDIKTGTGKTENFKIKFTGRYSYSKNEFKKDLDLIFNKPVYRDSFKNIGVSILKSGDRKFLADFFKRNFGINPVFINRDSRLPFRINYSRELGNDRICSTAGAVFQYNKKNILIIDFGTATTYTLISNKTLTGGLILPGVMTSLLSLINRTSLPRVKLHFPKKIFNNNTADNITSGVLYQSLFSAERIISEAKKNHRDLFVVSTGGYSNLISAKSKLINVVDQYLVLKGINYIISQ